MTGNISLILFYFLIIIFLTKFKTPTLTSPYWDLFKSLFPSWKFFDESVDTPILIYKTPLDPSWLIALKPPSRQWFHVMYNPEGNFYLAYHSHIQQLLGDLTSATDQQITNFSENVSYKITENFVRNVLSRKNYQGSFEFKISSIKHTDENNFQVLEDILLSPRLEIK